MKKSKTNAMYSWIDKKIDEEKERYIKKHGKIKNKLDLKNFQIKMDTEIRHFIQNTLTREWRANRKGQLLLLGYGLKRLQNLLEKEGEKIKGKTTSPEAIP